MTKPSKEARELLTAVYSTGQGWTFFDRREEQARLIQRAIDAARADAIEEAAKKAEAHKYPEGFLHYTVIRAMKTWESDE